MSFDAVVIDERTLSRGSEAQHVEWNAIIGELLAKAKDTVDYDAALHISVTEQHFVLEANAPGGDTLPAGQGVMRRSHRAPAPRESARDARAESPALR